MRPLVSSSIILAAGALAGVVAAGASTRPQGRAATGSPSTAPSAAPTFFAPSTDSPRGLAEARALPFAPSADLPDGLPEAREFFFARAAYSGSMRGWGRGSWSTDYPKADRQFLTVIERLVGLDLYRGEHAILLTDPSLRRFPFLYALEVGRMSLSQEEVRGLRGYLEAGGFLVIDDFWGDRAWANLEYEMRRVLPGRPIVDLPGDHPLFRTFYDIDEILQVPMVRNGRAGEAYYSECRGCTPAVRGIMDDDGRLMVVIHWNTDLGDAWEWAEDPFYPLDRSTFAIQMGINMIVYAMSH